MDSTKLETLEIADANPRFLDKMTGQLPALKSLKLGKGWTSDEKELGKRTVQFLEEAPSLSRLSLHGYTGALNWTHILPRFGDSLEALELRGWESSGPS